MEPQQLHAYILDQLSGLAGIRSRAMMGGYIYYYCDKVLGGMYPGGFYVKDTPAARAAMPDAVPEPPLPGARPMLPVTVLDDATALQAMVSAMYDELPAPPARRRKKVPHGL